ncbi:hypothetical protein QE361_002718 [Sphingomonas sp. SORGH_AS802]|uniref:hypothetical protein n=1 Tax=Sphingomonas sp. SORGH_AS_0802 TaxID=3041800 RepID=UPI002861BFAC|nr:hypothetical protein [Sphingomonas sp. SORGH_AS_0802]MDR6135723.1 hypothetical protein [Sphingomonas sp. SORGH_AS_0802]
MLSLSSYHTAIIQTGAVVFSIAAPVAAPAFTPVFEIPADPLAGVLRAVNDNAGSAFSHDATERNIDGAQPLDDAHNEALFHALMSSSVEVSGPFMID